MLMTARVFEAKFMTRAGQYVGPMPALGPADVAPRGVSRFFKAGAGCFPTPL